jgi:predicted nucleic acid-binding protein
MIQVALDTSLMVGLLDPRDIWHLKSLALKNLLIDNDAEMVVFDCVLAETISVVARRFHEKQREKDLTALLDNIIESYPPENISWILPRLPQKYFTVLDLVRASNGELNFNDALIALTCQEHQIRYIASFDKDFDKVSWLKRLAKPSDLE